MLAPFRYKTPQLDGKPFFWQGRIGQNKHAPTLNTDLAVGKGLRNGFLQFHKSFWAARRHDPTSVTGVWSPPGSNGVPLGGQDDAHLDEFHKDCSKERRKTKGISLFPCNRSIKGFGI
jgi:hypothetical protein